MYYHHIIIGNRLRALIVLLFLLCVSTAVKAKKSFTLVVDAGHGGKDTGACGRKSKEKTLTLTYALAFGKMVERNCPDVEVVYTRKTDRFLELWQRAEIANNKKADLFVSVHINALPKGKYARGFQTYTLGRGRHTGTGFIENLEVAKRENAVILLEKNYKQTYQGYDPNSPESDIMFEFIQDDNMERSVELARLMQRNVCKSTGRIDQGAHQENLAVLRLTSMPGCLVELGFISTPDEEDFLCSESSVEKYARGMFNAFQAYRRVHDPNFSGSSAKQKEQEDVQPKPSPTAKPDSGSIARQQQETKSEPTRQPEAKPTKAEAEPAKAASDEKKDTDGPETNGGDLVFKVQFMASSRQLKAGAAEFKGLKDVGSYQEDNLLKYTVGSFSDYDEALRTKRQVAQTFPQAFVVAFRGSQKVDINTAISEFRKKQKK